MHEAEGHDYLVRERYEGLLWWLQLPSLLRLAGETAPSQAAANRAAVRTMSKTIDDALAAAEAAGYRVDLLRNPYSHQEPASDAKSVAHAAVAPEGTPTAIPSLKEPPESAKPKS